MTYYNANRYALEKVASLLSTDPAVLGALSDDAILEEVDKDEVTKKLLQMQDAAPSPVKSLLGTGAGGLLGALGGYGGAAVLNRLFPEFDPNSLQTKGAIVGGLLGSLIGYDGSREMQASAARDALLKMLSEKK